MNRPANTAIPAKAGMTVCKQGMMERKPGMTERNQ